MVGLLEEGERVLYHPWRGRNTQRLRAPAAAVTLAGAVFAALLAGAGCAADPGDRTPDGGAERDVPQDLIAEAVADRASDRPTDGFAPGPDVAAVVEPPLTVRMCGIDPTCCASALGFEDGTTMHFLPASCCRLALSNPQLVAMPTACGHGALKLSAEFPRHRCERDVRHPR